MYAASHPKAYHRTASDARLDRWSDKMHGDAAEAARQPSAPDAAEGGVRGSTGSLLVAVEEVDMVNCAGEGVSVAVFCSAFCSAEQEAPPSDEARAASAPTPTAVSSPSSHSSRAADADANANTTKKTTTTTSSSSATATAHHTDRFGFFSSSSHAGTAAGTAPASARKGHRRAKKWLAMLSDWPRYANAPKLKARCRKGVPDELRATVWMKLSGAHQLMRQHDTDCYRKLLDVKEAPWEDSILLDVDRTFPRHAVYAEVGGEGQRKLFRVLRAYSLFDPDLGYCQGLAFVVGFLCTYLLEEDCFWLLVAIMHRDRKYALTTLYAEGMPQIRIALSTLDVLLEKVCPRLSRCLGKLGIASHMYATSWFMSLFTSNLPFSLTVRIWDMFLCEGWKVLYRIALGLLCSFDKTIKYDRSLDFACMLRKMQAGLPALLKDESADTIVNAALGVRLTTKQIAQVEMDAKVAWRIE
jgi:TBC1 domain family member 10